MIIKFTCLNVEQPREFPGTENVTLAVIVGSGPQFHTRVPQGEFKLRITNPEMLGAFQIGKEYDADFVEAAIQTEEKTEQKDEYQDLLSTPTSTGNSGNVEHLQESRTIFMPPPEEKVGFFQRFLKRIKIF